jgi:hypothetical protein
MSGASRVKPLPLRLPPRQHLLFPSLWRLVLAVGLIAFHPLLANAVLSQVLIFRMRSPVGCVRHVAPLFVRDSSTNPTP